MNDRLSSLRPSSRALPAVLLGLSLFTGLQALEAQSLLGSRTSMLRQNEEAAQHDFSYLQTSSEVREFADQGWLVRIPGNESYRVADVSFPYARPEVKVFVERLASQYRNACGERLVVTSLTRPADHQPRNASPLSVHPTGMALDLRRSGRTSCRNWLERNLLTLEDNGVVEATKERHPPHYHIAVFPKPYLVYLASRGDSPDLTPAPESVIRIARSEGRPAKSHVKATRSNGRTVIASHKASAKKNKVRVGRGDSLWSIAQRHGVSVAAVKRANRIRNSHLKPGQVLAIPSR